jgi:hypothetical protein
VRTSSPEALYVFLWDAATRSVRYQRVVASSDASGVSLGPVTEVRMDGPAGSDAVQSNGPIGGTWNPKTGQIVLVTTHATGGWSGRMKMLSLRNVDDGWRGSSERWVYIDEASASATVVRPSVIFDDRPSAGSSGRYLIYSAIEARGAPLSLMELTQLTETDGAGDVWTRQLMMNIWTTTRGGMSAVPYKDDIAWAWRKDVAVADGRPGSLHNTLHVYLHASGIADSGLTDFDDVTWLARIGLRRSLAREIRQFNGAACAGDACPGWQRLDSNGRTTTIRAGTTELYQQHFDGKIWRYTGTPCGDGGCPGWQLLDNNLNTRSIVAAGTQLYQLHADGKVWRYTGTPCAGEDACPGWELLDKHPRTKDIAAGGSKLYQLRSDGTILRYAGPPCGAARCDGWKTLDTPPRTKKIAAGTAGELFQLGTDGSIRRYNDGACARGRCVRWRNLDNNPRTRDIAAGGGALYQLHDGGAIWRFTGALCSGGRCLGWERLDENPRSVGIVAGSTGQLYQIHVDGMVWRYTGAPCAGDSCLGWERLDNNEQTTLIDAGNGLFKLSGPP